ncbi:MAG: hypothetical protein NXI16_01215 [Alphaproteobacteria bacterium]|nr:hypothetical protein [Alphaproteobacteria bacterium]
MRILPKLLGSDADRLMSWAQRLIQELELQLQRLEAERHVSRTVLDLRVYTPGQIRAGDRIGQLAYWSNGNERGVIAWNGAEWRLQSDSGPIAGYREPGTQTLSITGYAPTVTVT